MIINSNTYPKPQKKSVIVNDLKRPTQTVVPEKELPENPLEGPIYYNESDKNRYQWNGDEWVLMGGLQSDWNQTDGSKSDFIKNKPTIPAAQVQADWDQTDESKADFIKNKPTIPSAALQEKAISNNTWDLNFNYQTLSSLSISANTTLTLSGTNDDSNLRITHLIRIDNTSASNVTVTFSKGIVATTHINYIRCINNIITIPANNSLELSCYITKESIGGVYKYIANVTEYNGLQLY